MIIGHIKITLQVENIQGMMSKCKFKIEVLQTPCCICDKIQFLAHLKSSSILYCIFAYIVSISNPSIQIFKSLIGTPIACI